MKKMLDSKFLFILSLSILVLIGLGIGAFYLFDNSDNNFVKSGYVLNPLSSKVEKYFFDEKTSYRENLSSMIEFKDVDDKFCIDIFENGKFTGKSTRVLKALPFTLIEAYQVWEMYFEEERKVTDIFVNITFRYSPKKSDIQFIIWALRKGKCDWMLENTKDYRYDFDFKKFIGISK